MKNTARYFSAAARLCVPIRGVLYYVMDHSAAEEVCVFKMSALSGMISNLKQKYIAARSEKRRQRLCGAITRDMFGLEIGPSHHPCVPKRMGYHVETVDYLDREGLIAKYAGAGVPTDGIEPVDYVWDGRPYSQLTGKQDAYDYIVASHVVEHVTDLLGFLLDCQTMLKPGGLLILAVPDKRYTFDRCRMVTRVDRVLQDHLQADGRGSYANFADYTLHTVRRGSRDSWKRELQWLLPPCRFVRGWEQIRADLADWRANDAYHDIHQYTFTPASFTLLVEELFALGEIRLCVASLDVRTEFIAVLKKDSRHPVFSDKERMRLLKKASRENRIG